MSWQQEEWRPVRDYEGIYEVSNFGFVCRLKTHDLKGRLIRKPRILSLRPSQGYPEVILCNGKQKRFVRVHRIVLEAFCGPCPEGFVGAHLDGSRDNNRLDNLAWVSPAENSGHMKIHGTRLEGEMAPWAKLTDADIRDIRNAYPNSSQRTLAKQFGVSQANISLIVTGKSRRSANVLE